jgi:uncharacterized protein (TIGR01777 family)
MTLLWTLIAIQVAMGAFDTLYHHELTERLGWRVLQRHELKLHGVRNLLYAVLLACLGWAEAHGVYAYDLLAILLAELLITLMDFVEEDESRRLPASERVTHTLLALNFGAILLLLVPLLLGWGQLPTAIIPAWHGAWSWFCAVCVVGVVVSGLRDFAASFRLGRIAPADAAGLVKALPRPSTVLISGGTGFIGTRLVEALAAAGHIVIVLTRDAAKASLLRAPYWLVTDLEQIPHVTRIDAIVNLAGESISDGLWTRAKRARIIASRMAVTGAIVKLIERLDTPPSVLVSGSAIGWYGLTEDETLDEDSPARECFSHDVCAAWEDAAKAAKSFGVRVVLLRIGLVLGTAGGMLARLLLPFELGLGGPIGSGKQWMSWIARDDLVRLIAHAIAAPSLLGPVNATAPAPVRNKKFAHLLGRALHRPAFMPLPAAPLRLALGDFAKELLLGGQRVMPRKALESGFLFRHPDLTDALGALLGNAKRKRSARKTTMLAPARQDR